MGILVNIDLKFKMPELNHGRRELFLLGPGHTVATVDGIAAIEDLASRHQNRPYR